MRGRLRRRGICLALPMTLLQASLAEAQEQQTTDPKRAQQQSPPQSQTQRRQPDPRPVQETVQQAGQVSGQNQAQQQTQQQTQQAAQQAAPPPPARAARLDTVIVTGSALPRRRFDAAYANATVSDAQIERFAPHSAADLFGKLAGFASEPSGGEAGNNVSVRGLPSGNFLFIPMLQDGLPVFQEAQEAFVNADELARIDLMTERVEAVRGGTSPIYASNAPGATLNLISRKGGATPQGSLRGTWGNYGLARLDGQWSGPLAGDWRLAMGGYYRVDKGLRPPGFTADQGGQFRINLTRRLRDGELTLYASRLDDRNAFYLPIPLADPRNPARPLSHLLDPRSGTLSSDDIRHARLRTLGPGGAGVIRDEDLAEGIHPAISTLGASLDRKLGDGWTLSDKLRYTDGSVKFNALFSLTPPEDAAALLASELGRARAGFGAGVDRLAYTLANRQGPLGAPILFDPATTDGLVVRGGWWSVDTHLSNLMNDARLSKTFSGIGPGSHQASAGLYLSNYKFSQARLFNTVLLEMRNRPRALDLTALDRAGNPLGTVTERGFLDYASNGDLGGHVDGRLWALYAADEWQLNPRWRFDVGIRHQRTRHRGEALLRTTANLGDPRTLADDKVGGPGVGDPGGAASARTEHVRGTAWTVGANVEVSPQLGAFARYTASFRTPTLGNIYTGAIQPPAVVSKVREVEFGTKHRYHDVSAYVTAFWNRFNPLQDAVLMANAQGILVDTQFVSRTENRGVEVEASWQPHPRFELLGNLTAQRPRYKHMSVLASGAPLPGVEGKQLRRMPRLIGSLTPTWTFDAFGRTGKLYATLAYQGKKYVDSNNTTVLPAYRTLDAGVSLDLGAHWRVQLVGSNLGNETGLTEGNPRTDPLQGQGTGTAIYARPIFGRTVRMSLTYEW